MKIKPDFQFSQSSIQDYLDCQRRFELRYLLRVEWPALESEPVLEQEGHMELGHRFHQIVQQHILGISEEELAPLDENEDLSRWWQNYRQAAPLEPLPEQRYVEYTLALPLNGYRLLAKFDLVAVQPGQKAIILDWKTSRKRQPGLILRQRVQSRVYPFVLACAGAHINGGTAIQPDQIEMVYWFPEFPDQPERFPYSAAGMRADQEFLSDIICEIAGRETGQFFPADDERRCRFCVYRSLCSRGARPGDWTSDEEGVTEDGPGSELKPDLDFNFDQMGEIAF